MADVNTLPATTNYFETGWLIYAGKTGATPDKTILLEKLALRDLFDYAASPMIVTGGAITEGAAGTFTVAELTAMLRTTDSLTGTLIYKTLAEQADQSITAANTFYYICLDYNGGSLQIVLSTTDPYSRAASPDRTQIVIGAVMKDSADNVHYTSGGYNFQDGVQKLHKRIRTLRRIELCGGSIIAYSGTNNFTMTEGLCYNGINEHLLAAYNSAVTAFTPIYSDGGAGFTEGADRNTIDYTHYDNGTGALGSIGVAKYGCHWVYRHIDDGHVFVRYGTTNGSLATAEEAQPPTSPDHLLYFGILIGKIIAPYAGGSFTTIQQSITTHFTGTAVADHELLGNLQGGAVSDHVHLTAVEYAALALAGMTASFSFGGQAHGGSATVAFSASKTFDADDGNNQKMVTTATTTIGITNELPGTFIFTLVIDSGASPEITIGASFGTVMDNSADLLDANGDINIITLVVDPDGTKYYTVNTITA